MASPSCAASCDIDRHQAPRLPIGHIRKCDKTVLVYANARASHAPADPPAIAAGRGFLEYHGERFTNDVSEERGTR